MIVYEKKLGPRFPVFHFCFRPQFFESHLKSIHGCKRSSGATGYFCGKILLKND